MYICVILCDNILKSNETIKSTIDDEWWDYNISPREHRAQQSLQLKAFKIKKDICDCCHVTLLSNL